MKHTHSLAHADDPGFFEYADIRTAKGVQRECRDLQRRISATRGELRAALDRVIRTDWEREGRTFKNAAIGAKTREWYRLVAEISKLRCSTGACTDRKERS